MEATTVLLEGIDGAKSKGSPLPGQGIVQGPHGYDRVVFVLSVNRVH